MAAVAAFRAAKAALTVRTLDADMRRAADTRAAVLCSQLASLHAALGTLLAGLVPTAEERRAGRGPGRSPQGPRARQGGRGGRPRCAAAVASRGDSDSESDGG
jgi:hypothetical protein